MDIKKEIANFEKEIKYYLELIYEFKGMKNWHFFQGDVEDAFKPNFNDTNWDEEIKVKILNPDIVHWGRTWVEVPDKIWSLDLIGSNVQFRVVLPNGGEVFVDGVLKEKDKYWFETMIDLRKSLVKSTKFLIAIKWNGGFGSTQLHIDKLENILFDINLFLNELKMCEFMAVGRCDKSLLISAINSVDKNALLNKDLLKFHISILRARKSIPDFSKYTKKYLIHCVGHAHLDMNWMWDWENTLKTIKNTFNSVDKLMSEFPDLCFSQSQAHIYKTVEDNYPELFERIKKRVKEGRWEITASTWVEGDPNIASGESLVRQTLYAKKYIKEKFLIEPKICWAPDTFGHPFSYPQILKKCDINYYFFMRCGQGYPLFRWRGLDDSEVLCFNIEGYNGEIEPNSVLYNLLKISKKSKVNKILHSFGVGDHGGGPTRKDLKNYLKLKKSKNFPDIKPGFALDYYKIIDKQKGKFPVIKDELNFIFSGCYTTHADIKKMNREGENMLVNAEILASIASIFGYKYPDKKLEESWRIVCFNQFHDILDGSGIKATYEYSKELFNNVKETYQNIINTTIPVIANEINTKGDGEPVIVFNTLNWNRTDMVKIDISELKKGDVILKDNEGNIINLQIEGEMLYFIAEDVPSLGYKVYYITYGDKKPGDLEAITVQGEYILENEFYSISINPKNGVIESLKDKDAGMADKEVLFYSEKGEGQTLFGRGNVFQLWTEEPHSMSSWCIGNISKIQNLNKNAKVQVISNGPVKASLKIELTFGNSNIEQEIIVYSKIKRIDFVTKVNWQEKGNFNEGIPMLKVSFPVNVDYGQANFEIPFGFIERPANGKEVPALKWIDLSNKDYGVSLLNNCKYGHSISGNNISLTLIRNAYDPDPDSDTGVHEFTYSLYPHKKDFKSANVVKRGYELNNPLFVLKTSNHHGRLPAGEASFLKFDKDNLIVSAIKKSEKGDGFIIRFYDAYGKKVDRFNIKSVLPLRIIEEVNLLERKVKKTKFVKPFEIKTIKIGVKPLNKMGTVL
ncbi:MAG: glycoside hydrolase family 38 C-terminal domain-containing protein [Candidatus Firestonebacteria bacterium]